MLIKIVKCSIPEAWYTDNIGEEFEVLPYDNSCWVIPFPFKYWKEMLPLIILRSDCENLTQEKKFVKKTPKRIESFGLNQSGEERRS